MKPSASSGYFNLVLTERCLRVPMDKMRMTKSSSLASSIALLKQPSSARVTFEVDG